MTQLPATIDTKRADLSLMTGTKALQTTQLAAASMNYRRKDGEGNEIPHGHLGVWDAATGA
jgi:hypothetical protein